ncbi:hypothetical protein ACX80W_14770 [Arthrobacter sp. TMN-37]
MSIMPTQENLAGTPEGTAFRVLMKGVGAGSALGMTYGSVVNLTSGSMPLVVHGAISGMVSGFMMSLMCMIAAMVMHALTARFAPVIRAAAAATGAVLLAYAPFRDGEPSVQFLWPALVLCTIAAVLAVWFTRPLRRSPPAVLPGTQRTTSH